MIELFFATWPITIAWVMIAIFGLCAASLAFESRHFTSAMISSMLWATMAFLAASHPWTSAWALSLSWPIVVGSLVGAGLLTAVFLFAHYIVKVRKEMESRTDQVIVMLKKDLGRIFSVHWELRDEDIFTKRLSESVVSALGYGVIVLPVHDNGESLGMSDRGLFTRAWLGDTITKILAELPEGAAAANFSTAFFESEVFRAISNSMIGHSLNDIRLENMDEANNLLVVGHTASNELLFKTNKMSFFRTKLDARFQGLTGLVTAWFFLWPLFLVRFFFQGIFTSLLEAVTDFLRGIGTRILNKLVLDKINNR